MVGSVLSVCSIFFLRACSKAELNISEQADWCDAKYLAPVVQRLDNAIHELFNFSFNDMNNVATPLCNQATITS